MSHAISVPTPFNDIAELGESFAARVDEERLMLPHTDEIPAGEWVKFAVTLADGSAALSGLGRCTASYDMGEDREPEHRFDVVMDSLQLDEMAQVYFDRILQVRAAQYGDEPQTGEVELPDEETIAAAEAADDEEAPAEEHAEPIAESMPPAAAEEPVEETYEAAPEAAADGEPAAYSEPPPAEEPPDETMSDLEGASVDELLEAEPAAYEEPPYEDAVEDKGEGAAHDPPQAAQAVEESVQPAAAEYDEAEATQFGDAPDLSEYESAADAALDAFEEESLDAEALDSEALEAAEIDGAPPQLSAPEESAIYELPAPTPPGELPSPHSNGAVLTRRFLQASWSPEPEVRMDPSPSSGHFVYAVGAGLPVPDEPPRPEIDSSLRVAPAPRPGAEAAHAAPEAAERELLPAPDAPVYEDQPYFDESEEEYADETALEQETPAEASEYEEDADGYEAAPEDGEAYKEDGEPVAEEGADEAAEEDAPVLEEEPEYEEPETVQADVGEFEEGEQEPSFDELPPSSDDETSVGVELPDEE